MFSFIIQNTLCFSPQYHQKQMLNYVSIRQSFGHEAAEKGVGWLKTSSLGVLRLPCVIQPQTIVHIINTPQSKHKAYTSSKVAFAQVKWCKKSGDNLDISLCSSAAVLRLKKPNQIHVSHVGLWCLLNKWKIVMPSDPLCVPWLVIIECWPSLWMLYPHETVCITWCSCRFTVTRQVIPVDY